MQGGLKDGYWLLSVDAGMVIGHLGILTYCKSRPLCRDDTASKAILRMDICLVLTMAQF